MCVHIVCFQGVNLAQAKEKGQLIFLEGLTESLSVLIPHEPTTGSQAMDFLRYKRIYFLFDCNDMVALIPFFI